MSTSVSPRIPRPTATADRADPDQSVLQRREAVLSHAPHLLAHPGTQIALIILWYAALATLVVTASLLLPH